MTGVLLNVISTRGSQTLTDLKSFIAGDANAVKDFSKSTGRRRRSPRTLFSSKPPIETKRKPLTFIFILIFLY
jgi:hypothetical protein